MASNPLSIAGREPEGKTGKPIPERIPLAKIFQRLHRRDTSVPEAATQKAILVAYREGRLPLAAARVCKLLTRPVRSPDVSMDEPEPDDEKGWEHVKEMRKTKIVGFTEKVLLEGVDDLGPLVVHASRVPPPPANRVIEVITYDEQIPASISPAAIRFDWVDSRAVWTDKETGTITEFSGITALRADVEREWPVPAVKTPKEWAFDKVDRLLKDKVIHPRIGRRELSRNLEPLMKDDHQHELVTRAMPESSIYRALKEEWGVWPVAG